MSLNKPLAKILVVDDTPENVDVLAGVLNPQYRVVVALSGEKALKIAESEAPPDLILLDVMMPNLDGYEVCRRLKANSSTREIPVIFVTARSEDEDETRGFDLGAVDYFTKPISPTVVLARVRTHLALKHSLTRLEQLSAQLGRYLSPQVYQALFEGKAEARIQTSRKKLTVFFSDIVGFSAQTETLEPEDLHHVLNGYLNRMSSIVLKYGGTLDKFIGDAILVFFGDPETKGVKEDAIACVRMALEMREALGELRAGWVGQGITTPFEVRMGISTGYCTVGNFGSEQRMSYTIIGNQVNLASRLESAAAPGQVLISSDTWSLVQDSIAALPEEPIRVKGFEHPVQAYRVIGERGESPVDSKIELSGEGFAVAIEPCKISSADRLSLIHKLESVAAILR